MKSIDALSTRFFYKKQENVAGAQLFSENFQFSEKNEAQLILAVLNFLRGSFFVSIKKVAVISLLDCSLFPEKLRLLFFYFVLIKKECRPRSSSTQTNSPRQ